MIQPIRWIELELEGFGVWRAPVVIRFPERLGVLTLPNERGKSTLVAGLAAVLYGLPAEAIARRRTWGSSGPCRGRLDFAAGDRRIRIRRDLVSHMTIVEEIDPAGHTRTPLFNATANPAGRTAVKGEYLDALREILGDLADEDLFRATFLVTQPVLPAGEVSRALPRLLSGAGRVTGEEARDLLFDEVKKLTRATGDLGINATGTRPTNQRTDGRIETQEAEIERLSGLVSETSHEFERLTAFEDALRIAEEKAARAETEETHARTDAERLAAFRKDLAARDSARQARAELTGVLARCDEQITTSAEASARIARDFPDLVDAPADIETAIDEALALESAIGSAREDLDRITHEISTKRSAVDGERRWEKLPAGTDPVAWTARARATAERWCGTAAKLDTIAEEWRAAEAERSRLIAVAVLPDEVQDSLARLDEALAELDERARMAERTEESRRLLSEGIARRREAFERRWAPLEGIDPATILATLESRAGRHRRLAEIETQAAQIRATATATPGRSRLWKAAAIGIPVAAIAAAIPFVLRLPAFLSPIAGVIVLALAYLFLARAPRRSRDATRRLAALDREAEQIRLHLRLEFLPSGPWLPDDANACDRARAAFLEMDEEEASIARDDAALTDGSADAEAARLVADCRGRRERLETAARGIEEATGLPAPDAVRAYRRVRQACGAIGVRHASAVIEMTGNERSPEGSPEETFGGTPEEMLGDPQKRPDPFATPLSALGPMWKILVDAVPVLELDLAGDTLFDLRAALAGLPAGAWDGWEVDARAFADAQTSLTGVESDMGGRTQKLHELDTALNDARERIGPARIAASGTNLAALRARVRERSEMVQQVEVAEHAVRQLLDAARGGPFPDRDALAASLAEIEDRRRDAQHRCDAACEESDLVREYDRNAADPATQDRIRREIEARAGDLSTVAKDARDAHVQARATLEAWRPPSTVNMAAIEIDIARLRGSAQVLRRRRDADTRAWRILGDAVDEFRAAHRETLAEKIDARFRVITQREGRRIGLDPNLEVDVIEDGASTPEEDLSQGARDQLAFCLRLAVADLIGGELVLPLLLDDPFVHSDPERLARIRAALDSAAHERQIVLLTQDERLRDWGEPIAPISSRSE